MNKRSTKSPGDSTDTMLSAVPAFAALSEKDRRQIAGLLTSLDVMPGATLATEGHAGRELIIVIEGTAIVSRGGETLATVGPGAFIGEISLIDGGKRTATVTAESSMRLMIASWQEFNALLDRAPEIARRMLPALAARIRELSSAEASL